MIEPEDTLFDIGLRVARERVFTTWYSTPAELIQNFLALTHFSKFDGMNGKGIPFDRACLDIAPRYTDCREILEAINQDPLNFAFTPEESIRAIRDWFQTIGSRNDMSISDVARIRYEAKSIIKHLNVAQHPEVDHYKPAVKRIYQMFSFELDKRCKPFRSLLENHATPAEFLTYFESFPSGEDPWKLDDLDIIVRHVLINDSHCHTSSRAREKHEREFSQTPVRVILRFLRDNPELAPNSDSYLIDIGSGCGISTAVFSLLTGCRAKGIEIDPSLHKVAKRISRYLPIDFLNIDALVADFQGATHVYFASSLKYFATRKLFRRIREANSDDVSLLGYWDINRAIEPNNGSSTHIQHYSLKDVVER